jgi:hypothetical protein
MNALDITLLLLRRLIRSSPTWPRVISVPSNPKQPVPAGGVSSQMIHPPLMKVLPPITAMTMICGMDVAMALGIIVVS